MFWVVLPPNIRSAYNCIYSICYLSHRYCYLPLSWKSWNRFECALGGVWHIPDAVDKVVCAPDDVWKYEPKHVEQFPDINKLCDVASCWMYIEILLGAQYILHISRKSFKQFAIVVIRRARDRVSAVLGMYKCSSEKQVQRKKHCGSWVNGYRRRCLGRLCMYFLY